MTNIHMGKYKDLTLKQMAKYLGKGRLGEVHYKDDGTLCFEDKCHYCGKWKTYTKADIDGFMLKGMWDFKNQRLKYCGDSVCTDFVEKETYYEDQKKQDFKRKVESQYLELLKSGLLG